MIPTASPTVAAIYVRTATVDHERDALAEQEAVCRTLCAERGYAVEGPCVYRDVGSGLSIDDRGGLSRLRDDIAANRIGVVVAVSPDRLSRDESHLAQLQEEADAAGVRMEYVNVARSLQLVGWPANPRARVSR